MLIDGKVISRKVLSSVKNEVEELKSHGITPGLAVILVGNDSASEIYVNNKKKACLESGIYSEEYILPESTSQKELIELIETLNCKNSIDGILAQLPLPKHINQRVVCESISAEKDVDVFNSYNVGRFFLGNAGLLPCTPAGIMELLKHENISISGKNCTVIGRSNIVGKPTAMLLLQENGTVTVCHSKTKNLKEICLNSDIIVSAAGKPNFITGDMIKQGAVVIDVGINRDEIGKLCGDVELKSAGPRASYITPVPGGVGPMTIAMLMKNTVLAAKMRRSKS